ncbi:MAG: hypothetical protein EOP48_19275 [Sphingobacteriales bacterium]|nr:MAG: hypothetical protein EOP48_19275 [Sphingobacteriales bacterium]
MNTTLTNAQTANETFMTPTYKRLCSNIKFDFEKPTVCVHYSNRESIFQAISEITKVPYKLPYYAAMHGVTFNLKELEYLLRILHPGNEVLIDKKEMPLSCALFDEGASVEDFSSFLLAVGVLMPDGDVSDWFLQEGYAYPRMVYRDKYARLYPGKENEVSLTATGIKFIEDAWRIYRIYGYRLMMNLNVNLKSVDNAN